MLSNKLNEAIDSLCDPGQAADAKQEDKYARWKRCKLVAENDSPNALNLI
jgi:hypothetical protein